MHKKTALLAVVSLLSLTPRSFGQYLYIVGKEQEFSQTGNSTANADPTQPFKFEANINNDPEDSSTPTPPNSITPPAGGVGVQSLVFNPGDSQWEFGVFYTNITALNTDYPNGSYTFTSGGNSTSFNLAGDLYTNVPIGSFSLTGVWSGNVYKIMPGQDLTITTNTISGFSPGSFRVGIDANPVNFGASSIKYDSLPSLTSDQGNIIIPAAELGGGDIWDVELQFNAFSELTNPGLNGGTDVAIYTMRTSFEVQAIPEPSETALIMGLLSLGALCWRRRRLAS